MENCVAPGLDEFDVIIRSFIVFSQSTSMCASSSMFALLKISIKTFWYYSEQYKTLPNLISYHTKKSQILLIFVTGSNTFLVMYKCYTRYFLINIIFP